MKGWRAAGRWALPNTFTLKVLASIIIIWLTLHTLHYSTRYFSETHRLAPRSWPLKIVSFWRRENNNGGITTNLHLKHSIDQGIDNTIDQHDSELSSLWSIDNQSASGGVDPNHRLTPDVRNKHKVFISKQEQNMQSIPKSLQAATASRRQISRIETFIQTYGVDLEILQKLNLGASPFMKKLQLNNIPVVNNDTVMGRPLGFPPPLVTEETTLWRETYIDNWFTPYVLTAYHVPEKNWLVVFTQGYNYRIHPVDDKQKRRLNRVECIIGGAAYPIYPYRRSKLDDVVVCDITPIPGGVHPRYGDRVTIATPSKSVLRSLARFLPRPLPTLHLPKYNVCMYTQIKNMAHYVTDWVNYHRRVGVDHFFVNDNNSTDNVRELFEHNPYVDVHYWPWRKTQAQAWVYARLALEPLCKWVAFVDIDQYIYINPNVTRSYSLADELAVIESTNPKVGQVSLFNKVYGSSGRVVMPTIPVPEAYVHTKVTGLGIGPYQNQKHAFIRPSRCTLNTYIHWFWIRKPWTSLELEPEKMHWNHYKVRSWEDYLQKFSGRNGLVQDWPAPTSKDPKIPPTNWIDFHGTITDTSFRDIYRNIMSDNNNRGDDALKRRVLLVFNN